MALAFDFGSITNVLSDLDQSGVRWVGKASKWGTAAEAQGLIDAIDRCKILRFLNLEGNTLGVEAAGAIAKALEKHPELQQALWKDLFTGRMKEEIPIALKALGQGMITAGAQLTVLDCSDNALGPNGMVGLVDLLKSATCYSLKELKLNNCGLGIEGGTMLAKALLEGHAGSKATGKPLALKVFIAGRNRLENAGAKALSEMFATIGTLEQIEMPQNGIYHPGITALSEAFKGNPNLRILNLNDNTIGPRGAAALADALVYLQQLREINFGDCLLKTRGALLIGEALHEEHLQIELLDFGFNEIGPEGGLALVNAAANKERLRSIVLNGNAFGDECCEQMIELMDDYGRADAFGPLDEDAGDNEEDDEDEDEEVSEEEEEEEEPNEDEDNDETDEETAEGYDDEQPHEDEDEESLLIRRRDHTVNDTSTVSIDLDATIPNTIESFCHVNFPTETMFLSLPDTDLAAGFREYLAEATAQNNDYLTHVAFTILKCSELAEQHPKALAVAIALYHDAFDYARANQKMTKLRDFILIQLGLLKSEEPYKPTYNVQSCRYALRMALDQQVVPEEEQMIFRTFLDRIGQNE
ncbi:ran gtpase-activating protein [Anopheles darlingi]|uniref:Ran gtpase-activating protein n=1 Tax=Anopheles darlingi TaxID=43151 RepID=W5JC64_ANODA|nr:ran GTPase-activating protein [Anopheles darlingi]ETN60475.1 ran gtpase-activating protein [Anopheles darlingi]